MNDAPLMLSVSGLRGLIGQSLTPEVAVKYGAAVGQWFKEAVQRDDGGDDTTRKPHIVVGRDSRPSGPLIESAVIAGLVSVGCRVTKIGIVTTPGVAIMTEHVVADGGLVITASHNPIIWNGIKTLRADGVAPPADQAQRIIDGFRNETFAYVAVDQLGTISEDATANDVHRQRVLQATDVDAIAKRRFKVVLDSVHGAGGPVTAKLMSDLGVELVHLYGEPTGQFPHTPEPTRENLTGLSDAVREHCADIGFAQDPDADRLAIVDNQGNYIGEEYTLALATHHVLSHRLPAGAPPIAAANLSTSRMIDDIAAAVGGKVLRTAVGEANVAAAMREHNAVVGGEGNGGIIWPEVGYVRDSLVGIALVLEMLAATDQSLSDIVAAMPAYAIVKHKEPIQAGMTDGLAQRLADQLSPDMTDTQDGVRLDWADRWVHVRPSNTEPILRIIAEAPRQVDAEKLVADVQAAMNK